jgi:hypothetical protein
MAAAVSANNMVHLFPTPEFIRTPFPGVPEDLRCRYTSKPCGNLRTTKRGGGLHRFCDYHRARANENQWRVDHRRRLRKIETGNPLAPPRERSPRHQVRSPTALPVLMPSDCAVGCADNDVLLSSEELLILQALLFSDDDDDQDVMTIPL